MIVGIGTDLIEIERIKKACEKEAFLVRVYTEEERRQAGGKVSRLAGDFAVKEAVSKVFGTGFRGFGLLDIEVLRDELGKPWVRLHGGAKKLADSRHILAPSAVACDMFLLRASAHPRGAFFVS